MWALECEIIPGEVDNEGPFAEVTGYYAHVDKRPVVHVRKIHRREKPVFQTILSGIEVWNRITSYNVCYTKLLRVLHRRARPAVLVVVEDGEVVLVLHRHHRMLEVA